MTRGFAGRDLVSINDFTNEEIEAVLDLADEMNSALDKRTEMELCKGLGMATLFYEPSTRTRGSFERAMHKLGGQVVSFAQAQTTSSVAKGETIADTARVLEGYADIIVIRNPLEGSAKVAADFANVPVINAGDGAHEHPTQTLCDLYMIRKERGRIKGSTICLRGDLKYGRTVHSLVYALARLGAEVFLWPQTSDLDMPEGVLRELRSKYDCVPMKVTPDDLRYITGEVEVLYIAPVKPFTYPLGQEFDTRSSLEITVKEVLGRTDVIYVTRVQSERRGKTGDAELEKEEAAVTRELLGEFRKKPLVMHPLPRVNELPSELDSYPRSVYFQQAKYGVPIRMALTALLLGATQIEVPERDESLMHKADYDRYKETIGVDCPNPDCVLQSVRERRNIAPEFTIVDYQPLTLRCVYCEHETRPAYVASSDWHEGRLDSKRYHGADSHWVRKIRSENLIIFDSKEEAETRGFKPSRYIKERA
jgi:aspartate carbamoyltransferase catalytic subunit